MGRFRRPRSRRLVHQARSVSARTRRRRSSHSSRARSLDANECPRRDGRQTTMINLPRNRERVQCITIVISNHARRPTVHQNQSNTSLLWASRRFEPCTRETLSVYLIVRVRDKNVMRKSVASAHDHSCACSPPLVDANRRQQLMGPGAHFSRNVPEIQNKKMDHIHGSQTFN